MKKTTITAMALSAMVLFAGNSFATTTDNATTVAKEETNAEPLSVNYLGEDANYIYFTLEVKTSKPVSFNVTDNAEGELYSTVYKSDKVQTLKIEKKENQQLSFNVTAGKNSYSKSFTIMPTVALHKL
jgi:hypothetical protein